MSVLLKLLFRILVSRTSLWQWLAASFGLAAGLFTVIVAMEAFSYIKEVILKENRQEDNQYFLLINKQVSLINTFNQSVSYFTADEIDTLKGQAFIKGVAPIQSNTFALSASFQFQTGLQTILFFESVDPKYLDVKTNDFDWDTVQRGEVPVIVSKEFLNLYNFGVAISQGFPQLPEAALQMVPFDVVLNGNGKKETFKARIVGFSDRFPTILVPVKFLEWANQRFGTGTPLPTRIMLQLSQENAEGLTGFLEKKGYTANKENIRKDLAKKALNAMLFTGTIVGGLFIILSTLLFIMQFQLLVARAKTDLDNLFNLGYSPLRISLLLISFFGLIIFLFTTFSFLSSSALVSQANRALTERGFPEIVLYSNTTIWLVLSISSGVLILNILTVINVLMTKRK